MHHQKHQKHNLTVIRTMDSEVATKKRKLFFNNLLLLGLDVDAMEKQHKIAFHKDMFAVTNKKGFEVVSHFLFSKLNEVSKNDYSLVWPLLHKESERSFQKSCFMYLTTLSQNSSVRFPRVVQSVLATYSGDRFYDLYFSFSCHVVKEGIHREHLDTLLLSRPTNLDDGIEIVKMSTICCLEEFKNIIEAYHKNFQSWSSCAKLYAAHYQKLEFVLSSYQASLNEKNEGLSSLIKNKASVDNVIGVLANESTELKKKVQHDFEILESFTIKEKELWNCLASELDESEKPFLDGTKCTLSLPKTILNDLSDFEKASLPQLQKNGKVSILSFLQLFIHILEFYLKILKTGDLSKLKVVTLEDVISIKECLHELKASNEMLCNDIVPKSKENIKKLKDALLLSIDANLCQGFYESISDPKIASLNSENSHEERIYPETAKLVKVEPDRESKLLQSEDPILTNDFQHISHSPIESENGLLEQIDNSICDVPSRYSPQPNTLSNIPITSTFSPAEESYTQIAESNKLSECLPVQKDVLSATAQLKDYDPEETFKCDESWLRGVSLGSETLPNVSLLD